MSAARKRLRLVRLPWLAAVLVAAHVSAQQLGEEFEQQEWKEQVTHLPAFPAGPELIRTHVGLPNSFVFFVDPTSLDVGTDGVVRVTIVARAPSGTENVTFEGFRCATRERKIYAVGRPDRTWTQARNPGWTAITGNQRNPYLADLHDHYFCPSNSPLTVKSQTLRNLKDGRGQGMVYLPGGASP